MPNPLRDPLTAEAKAELAAIFSGLKRLYPPVRLERIGNWTIARPLQSMPWQNRRYW